jgi:cytochrome b pre-mRNA-processing protein 3
MLAWLTGKSEAQRSADELYGKVVAAARQPALYRDFSVADSPEGRYEMVALHLFLALESLKAPQSDDAVARMTIEAFVADMDDSMREMGVGDLTVPKRVKRAAAGFYERSGDYREALASPREDALALSLNEHIWRGEDAVASAALAAYVRGAAKALAAGDPRRLAFPDAAAYRTFN